MDYGNTVRIDLGFDETAARTRAALQEQGFGVLTEIDVQSTLKTKLGEDMEQYLILGACNPQLAHQTLEVERDIGLLLPCNVVVRRHGDRRSCRRSTPKSWSACRAGPNCSRSRTTLPSGFIRALQATAGE